MAEGGSLRHSQPSVWLSEGSGTPGSTRARRRTLFHILMAIAKTQRVVRRMKTKSRSNPCASGRARKRPQEVRN